jgi:DNA-binding MarR family transcriptional regulator
MDIDRELADLVDYAGRLSRLFTELAGPAGNGLTRAESSLLGAVAERPRRITELARLVGLTQPRITTLVQALEERGLVARAPDPGDGRAVLVEITGEGGALLAERRERIADALAERGLDAGEVVAGAAALRVVLDALET